MKRIGVEFIGVAVMLALSACGPDITFRRAQSAEKKGKAYHAWELYQEVAARYPTSPHASESLFRAGWLAQTHLNDCVAASTFYDALENRFPNAEPWAAWARFEQGNCPDYFPLIAGSRWVEGDSDSGGKHARIEVRCEALEEKGPASQAGRLERNYFAGDSKFKTTRSTYRKTGVELMEFDEPETSAGRPLLKWPLQAGTRWSGSLGGRHANYQIIAVDRTVKVAAGTFPNCLCVAATIEGVPGATNDYYAPGVGRILSAYATKEGERRNTELLSYDIKSSDDLPESKKENAP